MQKQSTRQSKGQGEVFRKNHSIRLVESTKTKRSFVTFLKNDRFLLLYLFNQIYRSKNILLDWGWSKLEFKDQIVVILDEWIYCGDLFYIALEPFYSTLNFLHTNLKKCCFVTIFGCFFGMFSIYLALARILTLDCTVFEFSFTLFCHMMFFL